MNKILDTGKYVNPLGLIARKAHGTYYWGNSDSEESYSSYVCDPRNNKIDPFEYRFNSQGHRTDIEIEQLNDYVLTIGCSWSEGEGVPQELRYSELLAKELNLQSYCLGINGVSNDVIMHNLNRWLQVVKPFPKLIIMQWTFATRYSLISDGDLDWKPVQTVGPWRNDLWANLKYSKEFLIGGDQLLYWQQLRNQFINFTSTLCAALNIPVVQSCTENINDTILLNSIDLGRDQMHPGILSNQLWFKKILAKI